VHSLPRVGDYVLAPDETLFRVLHVVHALGAEGDERAVPSVVSVFVAPVAANVRATLPLKLT
jgi:hypothetical protein